MDALLRTYSIAELRDAAPKEAPEPPVKAPPVRAVQVDLFATQHTLFDHVAQPGELK